MKKIILAILMLLMIGSIAGFSVPFVKHGICADVFNCEQFVQNTGNYHSYRVKEQDGGAIAIPITANVDPVCSNEKKGDSARKKETVILEFMTLHDNVLIFSNGKMVFKHISYGMPFGMKGHGDGGSGWYFHMKEPSNATMDDTNDENFKNAAYITTSAQNISSIEKFKWKMPSFVPYALRLNYNPNCTVVVKNVQVLEGNVSVHVTSAINRMSQKIWAIKISKYPNNGHQSELVKLKFNVVYYGYGEEEEEEINE